MSRGRAGSHLAQTYTSKSLLGKVVPLNRLQLIRVVLEEDGLQCRQQRQVQAIEPHHRLVALVVVVVPVPVRGEDQVARLHIAGAPLYPRLAPLARGNETNTRWPSPHRQ